jgi:hypothetical protein
MHSREHGHDDRRRGSTTTGRSTATAARRVTLTATAVSLLFVFSVRFADTVAAHDRPVATGEGALSLGSLVVLAVGLSLLAGGAVTRYVSDRGRTALLRAVGVLLVVLGGSAVAVAVTDRVVVGGVAAVVGTGLALGVGHRRGHDGCADATLGAVLLHRCLEGALLATAATAGLVVGLVGAVVFAGHAAAETCAVGGLYATGGWRRGVLAVGLVQAAFVGGALGGEAVLATLSPTLRVGLVGLVGGVLLAVGLVESSTARSASPVAAPEHTPNH